MPDSNKSAEVAELLPIENESQAFVLLQQALRDEYEGRNVALDFRGWPVVALKLTGDGYDSTINTETAQAIVDLQHALNRAYARAVHHANARSLTAEEKRDIGLKAKVEQGSSIIKVDLGDAVEKLGTALVGKMTSTEIIITVLGVATIIGSVAVFKNWMGSRNEAQKVDAQTKRELELSAQETNRLRIVTEAMTRQSLLSHVESDFGDVRREFLRGAADAKMVSLQSVSMTGDDARSLAQTPRSASEDVQLNGHYIIEKVDFQLAEIYRITLNSLDNHGQFVATLRPGPLHPDQRELLQAGAWNRQRLYMQVNGTKLRGEITTASIVNVEWPKGRAEAEQ